MDFRLRHFAASYANRNSPLSADVYAFLGNSAWWIFDVGASDGAKNFIENLDENFCGIKLQKNIIISHFHQDHCANLPRLHYDNLFVSKETWKHFHLGTSIEASVEFDDGEKIRILPIPSSHAKGSLLLCIGRNAFLGDATYPAVGHGTPDRYNVQLLKAQIRFLNALDVDFFWMSHKRFVPREKNSVLQFLESVYATRQPNENWIAVNSDR